MIRLIASIAVCLLVVVGCTAPIMKNSPLVLDYADFGPQVIAHEVIGTQWWQWQDHGDSRPRDYGIKVVVYRETPLAEIKELFPVVAEQEQDFRYLHYDKALHYLNDKISENVIPVVNENLIDTRLKIQSHFGVAQ